MKKVAIATCRVSTPEQLNNGSMDRQDESVHKAAEELDAKIVKVWAESQSSKVGKNVKRKDLKEMVAYCQAHPEVKYLIVDEIDRFMRSLREMFFFEITFEELGVKVWYASTPDLNKDDHITKLMRAFEGFRAEGSNVERIDKSSKGIRDSASKGRYPSRPLQGYMKGKPIQVEDKLITIGHHVPDPTRFQVLQIAFREVLRLDFTPGQALARLNAEGYRTPPDKNNPNGNVLRIDHFKRMLVNPYYAGLIRMKVSRYEWQADIKGVHDAMITPEEHEQLKDIVAKNITSRTKLKHNPEFPLSNLLRCKCGGKLVGFNQNNGKGKIYPRYGCRSCKRLFLRYEVHSSVTRLLESMGLEDSLTKQLLKELTMLEAKNRLDSGQQVSLLEKRLTSLKQQKDNVVRNLAVASAEYVSDFEESLSNIKKEIEELDADIEKQKANIASDLVSFIKFALEFTQSLQSHWWELDYNDRQRCINLLFPEGLFIDEAKSVYTPEISPIYTFSTNKKEPAFDTDSLLVELNHIDSHSIVEELRAWRLYLNTEFIRYKSGLRVSNKYIPVENNTPLLRSKS